MIKRNSFAGILVLIMLLFAGSCKTTKKKGDVSKLGRFYHNTTSYYNGYFNANELYQNSLAVLEELHQDDYNKILSLYPYRDVPDTKSVAQDLDKVVEKLARVINLHRVGDWVDDSYLLMGKAQYAKQDFEKAQHVFEYFVDEMNPAFKTTNYKLNKKKKAKDKKKARKKAAEERKKKRKKKKKKGKRKTKRQLREEKERMEKEAKEKKQKEKEKEAKKQKKDNLSSPKTFHAKGTKKEWDTYNEGLLWMAKTYIEREKWSQAYYLLSRLRNENLPERLVRELAVATAYYYLKQKKYNDAVKYLKEAFDLTKDKKLKARYAFILGQIYEMTGRTAEAYKIFKEIEKLHPDYELEFNAKLKILKNYQGASDDYALQQLKKLLDEEKYDEYQDRIYFTMGEIMLNKGNTNDAIAYYNKSIAANTNNAPLKAKTYLRLAELNFDKQDYVMSKNYYDSTLMVLDKNDEEYQDIKRLANNLNGIAKNIQIIELQDSLIRISKMSKEEQRELALQLKKKRLEEKKLAEEKKKKQASKNSMKRASMPASQIPDMVPGGMMRRNQPKSSFFAYNPNAVKTGKQEFEKKWGNIRLEDNWRRSNRSDSDYADGDENNEDIDEVSITDAEVSNLLKAVPKTPEQLEQAHSKIKNAMLELGILYRDKLQNYKKSAEILEKLLNRYQDFEDECKAMYYLQFSYKDLGKYDEANALVNKMSAKHPDCIYTKILTDPNFIENKKKQLNQKELAYQNIYNLYKKGEYAKAMEAINNASEELTKNPKYKIKLDYLQAKLTGKLEGKDKYILALEDFVKMYPGTPEAIHAKETLRFLKGDKDAFSKLIYEEELEDFSYQPDKMHYILIVLKGVDDDELKKIKASISNYNKKYHKLDRLRMSNIYFDTKGDRQVILLRKFDSADAAMKYYNEVMKHPKEYIDPDKYQYEVFAISQKNYREVIKQRSVDKYRAFFKKYYLKEGENKK